MGEFVLVGVLLALGLGAYWAMVLFPRQRTFSKRQKLVQALSKGDEVITYGGVIGEVVDVNVDKGVALVEIADGIVVRVLMSAVVQRYDEHLIADSAQIALDREPKDQLETQTE